ncbi:hypothetical protein AGABI2DRAFT_195498 [Agaricus bisporus var. bisporus H97]|uniref:hypothetical protein n=1 Tax=Agaricus bisporus var. bisporus (strain H97 / ATCC MYA-4626 / FGSC 10389) TaxID=936046 RepID=UPI00029F7196|nr:hypothetical protein AGABI2DRAFT_195498 [Agaricus bisporus var. bisporus H97]EKV42651.1 hypothetical protein AGABI2DRAFT_195498 [Agaricus bisporus var. bisporus H97]
MSSALLSRVACRTRTFSSRNALRFSSGLASTTVPRPSSFRRIAVWTAATTLSIGAYTLGSIYPPATLSMLFPRPAPGPPTNPDSPESIAYLEDLESQLQNLPLLQSLRQAQDAKDWYETRPYKNFPEERRVNNLTAGALRGPGKFGCMPVIRAKRDESESCVFLHVGRGLCGHDGIIHGGLLATLLDECLGRTAIINLPDQVGVTATLSLKYRAPTRADQFIMIRTSIVEAQGRKIKVKGQIEDLQGGILVEADAMFVQPRYAKMLNTKAIKEVFGQPPEEPLLLADGEKLKAKHEKP